jgi:hypothetical protein
MDQEDLDGIDDIDDDIDNFDDVNDDIDDPSGEGNQGPTYTHQQVLDMIAAQNRSSAPQQQPQQQSLTEDQVRELKKQLRYPEVNRELVTQILGELPDDESYTRATAGLASFVEAISQHARMQSDAIIAYRMQQMQQQVQPLVDQTQQQQQNNFIESVAQRFPALAGKKRAISQAIQQMKLQGYQNNDIQAAMRDAAKTAAAIIRVGDPNFRLKQTASGSGGMLPLGRPGAGTKGGAGPAKAKGKGSSWQDIWN